MTMPATKGMPQVLGHVQFLSALPCSVFELRPSYVGDLLVQDISLYSVRSDIRLNCRASLRAPGEDVAAICISEVSAGAHATAGALRARELVVD